MIRGWDPIWLPDGTLVVFGSLETDAPHEEGFRRVTDHGFGATLETVVPTDRAELLHPLSYIVHGDLSGIQAREAGPEPGGA